LISSWGERGEGGVVVQHVRDAIQATYSVQALGHVGWDVCGGHALEPSQQQHVIVRSKLLPQQVLAANTSRANTLQRRIQF
jgi:hypothetical protein